MKDREENAERTRRKSKKEACTLYRLVGVLDEGRKRREEKEEKKNMFTHVLAACTSSDTFGALHAVDRNRRTYECGNAPVFTKRHFPRTAGDNVSRRLRSRSRVRRCTLTRNAKNVGGFSPRRSFTREYVSL